MSVQLLDKTRKINKLLHNNSSSKVVFNDICEVLTGILDSDILVISKKGKVLGIRNRSDISEITELIVDDGKSIRNYLYPYWFPFTLYTEVFPKLFPWAKFSVDEDYYEEYDKTLWHEDNCFYDKDDDEWYTYDGGTFEEYRQKLDPMRSIDHSGEVAEYMFILSSIFFQKFIVYIFIIF